MVGNNTKRVQATVHSFRILERLLDAEQSMGVTELSDAVGLSKGVVHTHLGTLSELGYVKKHQQRYVPSLGLLKLGEDARSRLSVFTEARHHVDNLARVTGEVATLFVEEDGLGVCVYTALGTEPWTPDYTCGSRIPLHINAPGKAILASFDRDRVDDIIDEHGLTRMTTETVTIPESLYSELENVKEDGVSFCRGEQFSDVVGVATTIDLNERGPKAAIGVCGPRSRLSGRYLEEDIIGQVISTAKSIQIELTR
ncbi:IclR family transcriptional regulator [Halogranum rubrum]|uniref:Transcriptional regulator n=1 Tax=Halogranum salarium B-1 TaxID=1210908 RepID=J2ZA55_9EURY|nr:IclR family transcriptional regulator [Halogranum salarium]EJN57540.1 transcriptional regulator [Halogranum salarium B-1]